MKTSAWIAAGGIALFATMAALVFSGATVGVDRPIMEAAPALHGTIGDALAIFVSKGLGFVALTAATAAVAIWLFLRRRRLDAVIFAGTMLTGLGTMVVLKQVFERARPTVFPWIDHADGFSFPSGHSFLNATFWLLVALVVDRPWARVLAVVMTLLAGSFRVVAGVHWPSDVVAGWSLGIALVACAALVRAWFTSRSGSAITPAP